jgi:hypothetical protein
MPLQATQAEVDAGTDDIKYITPLTFTSSQQIIDIYTAIDNIVPPAGGYANNLYFSETPDSGGIAGYKSLTYSVDPAETVVSNTINSGEGEKLINSYIYPSAVAVDIFPAGLWSFTFYGKVSSPSGVTQIGVQYFRRLVDNTEVNLFTKWSNEINNNTDELIQFQVSNLSFPLAITDRMGARIYLRTTHNSNITVTYAIGDGNGAFLNNPK